MAATIPCTFQHCHLDTHAQAPYACAARDGLNGRQVCLVYLVGLIVGLYLPASISIWRIRRDRLMAGLFIACLAGFDAMDATIYAIVIHPALHDLLQSPARPSRLSKSAGTAGYLFHLLVAGPSGDFLRRGRGPSGSYEDLIITILIYAIFTGLAALSHDWWHLAIYRFSRHWESEGNGRPARHSSLKPGRKRNERRLRAFSSQPGRSASSSLRHSIYCCRAMAGG